MTTYVVQVSRFHSFKTKARNPEHTKRLAWNDMKAGYRYGFKNWTEFRSKARCSEA